MPSSIQRIHHLLQRTMINLETLGKEGKPILHLGGQSTDVIHVMLAISPNLHQCGFHLFTKMISPMIKVMSNFRTIYSAFGAEDWDTMTKAAKRPFSIECDPFYILVYHFLVGGDIVSVDELLVVVVPITKRLIRRSKNLPVNSLNLIWKIPVMSSDHILVQWGGQDMLHGYSQNRAQTRELPFSCVTSITLCDIPRDVLTFKFRSRF